MNQSLPGHNREPWHNHPYLGHRCREESDHSDTSQEVSSIRCDSSQTEHVRFRSSRQYKGMDASRRKIHSELGRTWEYHQHDGSEWRRSPCVRKWQWTDVLLGLENRVQFPTIPVSTSARKHWSRSRNLPDDIWPVRISTHYRGSWQDDQDVQRGWNSYSWITSHQLETWPVQG